MTPKLTCSNCSAALVWGDRFCPTCGKPVEIPVSLPASKSSNPSRSSSRQAATAFITCKHCGESNSALDQFCKSCGGPLGTKVQKATKSEPPQKKDVKEKKAEAEHNSFSWKMMSGFAMFLVVGVIGLEMLTGKKPLVPEHDHVHTTPPAANMQVLPQIEELEKKVAANPDDAGLLLQLANMLHDNRFVDKAIVYYNRYLEKKPNDTDARVDLGICYNDAGRMEDAKKQMEEAIRLNPKHALAHFNLGIVHLQAGDVVRASEWFRKTINLAPTSEAAERAQRLLEQHVGLSNQ